MATVLWPTGAGWLALAAVLVIMAGAVAIGAAVAGFDRRRLCAVDGLAGLGIGGGAFCLAGAVLAPPLPPLALALGVAAAACAGLGLRRRALVRPVAVACLVPVAPLLLIAAAAPATGWDDFMHWLPNAAYLLRFGGFPAPDLGPTISVWPAYPYGLPAVVYGASLLAGRFVENAAAIANLVILAGFVPLLLAVAGEVAPLPRGWGLVALCAVLVPLVVVAGPGVDLEFVLSAYTDPATGIALAGCGVLGWLVLRRLAGQGPEGGAADPAAARVLARQFGAVAVLVLNLRQANPVPLGFLGLGLLGLAWRDPAIRLRPLLALLPALLLPPLILWLGWRHYVHRALPHGEFAVLPLAQWHFAAIPDMLASALVIMAGHPVFFGGFYALSGYALRIAWRGPRTPGERLAVVAGLVWLGHTAFLFTAFLGMFSDPEARAAGQYWRYAGEIGPLGAVAGVALVAEAMAARHWRFRPSARAARAALVVGFIGFPLGTVLVADRISPATDPVPRAFRIIGRDLADSLPAGARVVTLEPQGWGLLAVAIRYDLWRPGRNDRDLRVVRQIDFLSPDPAGNLPYVRASFANAAISHILINDPTPDYAAALGIPAAKATAFLLSRGPAGWVVARRWEREPGPNGRTE